MWRGNVDCWVLMLSTWSGRLPSKLAGMRTAAKVTEKRKGKRNVEKGKAEKGQTEKTLLGN